MPTEVFVSHSHVDQEFAERLVGVLRRHQIPVWYSDTDIQGAQQWHDEIGKALQRCDWFIVVLSPDSVASMGNWQPDYPRRSWQGSCQLEAGRAEKPPTEQKHHSARHHATRMEPTV